MVPETLMERPFWIGSVEEIESERRLFQQNRPKADARKQIDVISRYWHAINS
jgi:hypothetical protein